MYCTTAAVGTHVQAHPTPQATCLTPTTTKSPIDVPLVQQSCLMAHCMKCQQQQSMHQGATRPSRALVPPTTPSPTHRLLSC